MYNISKKYSRMRKNTRDGAGTPFGWMDEWIFMYTERNIDCIFLQRMSGSEFYSSSILVQI